jgi:Arc/MetJ-type ribon-helix-helix transcriptional regulator
MKNERKSRASFTLDKETVNLLDNMLKGGKYRSRSHAVELAIKLLNEKEKEGKK